MEDGILSPTQFVAEMGKVVKDLEMTVVCLGMEMPGTYKRIVADKAAAAAITALLVVSQQPACHGSVAAHGKSQVVGSVSNPWQIVVSRK